MHWTLLLLCFFAIFLNFCRSEGSSPCPDGFTFHVESRKCFLVISDKKMGQMDARLKCASKNAFLASVHSDDETKAIKDLLNDKKIPRAYIALQSQTYDVAERFWSDGTPVNYENWKTGKPDNENYDDGGCAVINDNGEWDVWSCSVDRGTNAAVCQISTCPNDFEYYPVTNNCYRILTKEVRMSQKDAQDECKKYSAHLVSIGSDAENKFISSLAMKSPYSAMRLYIGLESDAGTDASRRHWIDGAPVNYVNWAKTKPDNEPYSDNNCVVMIPENGGFWDDWKCDMCDKCQKWSVYGAACEIE